SLMYPSRTRGALSVLKTRDRSGCRVKQRAQRSPPILGRWPEMMPRVGLSLACAEQVDGRRARRSGHRARTENPASPAPSSYPVAMARDLFAGIHVSDYETARSWYERLLGREPTFIAHATEAVWELAEHRYLFIEQDRERPGGADITILVDDLDALVAEIGSRG